MKRLPKVICPFCKIKGRVVSNSTKDKWSVEFSYILDYPHSHHPECALRYVKNYPIYSSIEKLLLSWNPECYPEPPEIKKTPKLTKEQIAEDKRKLKHANKMLEWIIVPKGKLV